MQVQPRRRRRMRLDLESGGDAETGRKYHAFLVRGKKSVRDLTLVLEAMGIPYRTVQGYTGWKILVRREDKDEAAKQIKLFRLEQKQFDSGEVAGPPDAGFTSGYYSILAVFFGLYLFQTISHLYFPSINWEKAGALDADAFIRGEYFRAVTALTLHSDFIHLLSNAFFGGFTAYFIFRQSGSGFGWFLVLLSGVLGNSINAYLRHTDYIALGSSTALFGALGILASFAMVRLRTTRMSRTFLPLSAALAFLGLFGTGAGSDIGGHFFGFVSGLLIGGPGGFWIKQFSRPGMAGQVFFGLISFGVILMSWIFALRVTQ